MTTPSPTPAVGPLSFTTKDLPTIPSHSTSPSSTAVHFPDSPSSMTNDTAPTPTTKRDAKFASSAFAELHARRRASTLQAAGMRSPSPGPPPLPPKHELQNPDVEFRQTSISIPLSTTTSIPSFGLRGKISTTFAAAAPEAKAKVKFGKGSTGSRPASFLTKFKFLKRMSAASASSLSKREVDGEQGYRKSVPFRMTKLQESGKGMGMSFFDASSSSDENESSSGEEAGAEADEGEPIVRYAAEATFRRPLVVQCSIGPKVAMREILGEGPPIPSMSAEEEIGIAISPGDSVSGRPSLSGEYDFDPAAEKALERRLREDSDDVSVSGVLDEYQPPKWEKILGEPPVLERELEDDEERRGSAVSELDALVKQSLQVEENVQVVRPGKFGRKRTVQIVVPKEIDVGEMRVGEKVVSTPYPRELGMGGVREVDGFGLWM